MFRFLLTVVVLYYAQSNSFAQIQIGDTLDFWSVAYIDWQPGYPVTQRRIPALCKNVGQACYIFVETSIRSVPAQERLDDLARQFDENFSQNLPPLYGAIPDEWDQDPRVFILIQSPEGWTGYFDPAQQMADSLTTARWGKHSSQREILYLTTDAFAYNSEALVVLHELGHLLHWGRDHSPEPPDQPIKFWEDSWIDEAFAMFPVPYLLEGIETPNVMDREAFFAYDPDKSLLHFTSDQAYNQVKLWITFMFEHYGGKDFIATLIRDQANGRQGVQNTLRSLGYAETFEDTFEHWAIANYLDDAVYQNGKYGYQHYNFPAARLSQRLVKFPTGVKKGSVEAFAVDYHEFSLSAAPITIHLAADSSSVFRVALLAMDSKTKQVIDVRKMALDSLNRASFYADGLGTAYDKIVMAVMNLDTLLGINARAAYTYHAESEATPVIDPERRSAPISHRIQAQNYPNPFNAATQIRFILPQTTTLNVQIFNASGQLVKILADQEIYAAGSHTVQWRGTDENETPLASGIYWCQLSADKSSQTLRLVLLK